MTRLPGKKGDGVRPVLRPEAGEAVRAHPIRVRLATPRETLFRRILRDALRQVRENVPVILAGDDPEGVHQMRVGLRRLRACLATFAAEMPEGAVEPVRNSLRPLLDALGPARDWDVFLEERLGPAQKLAGAEPAFQTLLQAARRKQNKAWGKVRRLLASARGEATLATLDGWIENRGWRIGMRRGEIRAFRGPVGPLAREKLDEGHRRILRVGGRLTEGEADDGRWHRLRLAVKKQRYFLESFRSCYRPKPSRHYAKALQSLQEDLGAIQDLVVAETLLARLGEEHGETVAALVAGWRIGLERERAWRKEQVLARWGSFANADRPWHGTP